MDTNTNPSPVLDASAWVLTNTEADAFNASGEYFAAGFMNGDDVSIPMRHANGIANYLAHCTLPTYAGEALYPAKRPIWSDEHNPVLWHNYVALDLIMYPASAAQRAEQASSKPLQQAYLKMQRLFESYPKGGGYTHSIINFGRVLKEGLASYQFRIYGKMASASAQQAELYQALLVVLDAIDGFRMRIAQHLAGLHFDVPVAEANRNRLMDAFGSGLPTRSANGFFEAMLATTFMYAIDGSDDLGRFDQFMWSYYRDDIGAGRISREEALELVKTLWRYVDDCHGWNTALGGTAPDGSDACNELTVICLEAATGRRRPNLALRVRHDTPEAVWNAALDSIATGCGLPALYCEENYLSAIDHAQLGLSAKDRLDFAFGGCTELMVHGCSNVGSIEFDLNVLKLLEECMHEDLVNCNSFEELVGCYKQRVSTAVQASTEMANRNQQIRGGFHPQLIRTLLIDDCIDTGRSFSDRGARNNWSVVGIDGLANVIDSLCAVRKLVYEDRSVDAAELLTALHANFEGYDELLSALRRCPKFGNDIAEVDELAADLSAFVYQEPGKYTCWRGGRFIIATILFVLYGIFGQSVGATPDGRLAGTPMADSAGPVQGRDTHGPTAMLRSAASQHLEYALGTPVLNCRVAKDMVNTTQGRKKLVSLIQGYFAMGGMQLQINVVDQAVLKDAIEHPEHHADLIIRIGGYSEYFNALSPELKTAFLERTEHVG